MKLHSDSNSNPNRISAYGSGYFVVNDVYYRNSIIVSPEVIQPCHDVKSLADLDSEVLCNIERIAPEILVVGTGGKHHFPGVELLLKLTRSGKGVEVMRSDAACRTYNILVAENRNAAALLMLIDGDLDTSTRTPNLPRIRPG